METTYMTKNMRSARECPSIAGAQSVPERISHVAQAVNNLDQQIEVLAIHLDTLENKLQPVMRQEPNDPDSENQPRPVLMTPLAEAIDARALRLAHLAEKARKLMALIEL